MGWAGVLWGTGAGPLWWCWGGGLPGAGSSSSQCAALVGAHVSASAPSLSQRCAPPTGPLPGPSGSCGVCILLPPLTPQPQTRGVRGRHTREDGLHPGFCGGKVQQHWDTSPLGRRLDGTMTQRGQCWEPGVGLCAQARSVASRSPWAAAWTCPRPVSQRGQG